MRRTFTLLWVVALVGLGAFMGSGRTLLAQIFPEGIEGELYYAPRIDLISEADGGPMMIELDGELDDEFWQKAVWHDPQNYVYGTDPEPDEDDFDFIFAAAADTEYFYFAWRITDDILQIQSTGCNAWRDDSVELYLDGRADGPDCPQGGSCYNLDDAQLTVGADQAGKEIPEDLVLGGVAGQSGCDFADTPSPELVLGVVVQLREDEADPETYFGWQAEVAIALETMGNFDPNGDPDGTPVWDIDPQHGLALGFNVHGIDDDNGDGDNNHRWGWSTIEPTSQSWRNPGVFGRIVFHDPNKFASEPCLPVEDVKCTRNEDRSVSISWTNPDQPPGANLSEISILVDGTEVTTVAADADSVEFTSEQVPDDGEDHLVEVTNCSLQPRECTVLESQFDDCGGFRLWNLLGAYGTNGAADPGEDAIRFDYMTDGELEEFDFDWRPGAEIEADVGGDSAAAFVDGGMADRAPGGIPTVFSRYRKDGQVDLNSEFGGQLDGVMAYGQVYVTVDEPMDVFLGISSDDSVQVLIDGEEVWINNIARGGSGSCSPQDFTFDPVFLEEGTHSLMVKVFNGGGGWNYTLSFLEEPVGFGLPKAITDGISLSLEPPVGPGVSVLPGDVNGDAALNISDPVAHLTFLFASGPIPPCYTVPGVLPVELTAAGVEVLDFNGDDLSNIADAVGSLNYQFGGDFPPHHLGVDCTTIEGSTCEEKCTPP